MKNQLFGILLLTGSILIQCKKSETEKPEYQQGQVVSVSYVATYDTEMLNSTLLLAGVDLDRELKYSVKMFKVMYKTVDFKGNLVDASGALFIPQTDVACPLLSFQHGTQTKSSATATSIGLYSSEGFTGSITAALGYVTCVPDYLGLGSSSGVHPYLISGVSASSVVDMLSAVKEYCSKNAVALDNKLFLAGYSEGAYVTLAAQQLIEKSYGQQFSLTASAPAAGPYDLEFTTHNVFESKSYSNPAYAAFMLHAYNTFYAFDNINNVFAAPYAAKIPSLFDGSKTSDEINAQLPLNISSLMTENFILNYIQNPESRFWTAVAENSLLNQTPQSITYLIHSTGDEVVSFQNALHAYDTFRANGGNHVELIGIDGLSHSDAAIPAMKIIIEKFEALRE